MFLCNLYFITALRNIKALPQNNFAQSPARPCFKSSAMRAPGRVRLHSTSHKSYGVSSPARTANPRPSHGLRPRPPAPASKPCAPRPRLCSSVAPYAARLDTCPGRGRACAASVLFWPSERAHSRTAQPRAVRNPSSLFPKLWRESPCAPHPLSAANPGLRRRHHPLGRPNGRRHIPPPYPALYTGSIFFHD